MHSCLNRGYVVPAAGLLGPEPFDFQFRSLSINVGCNHLRCSQCSSPVRQRSGYTSDTYINRDIVKLSTTEDWGPLLGVAVAQRDDARLYYCQCQAMSVVQTESLEPDPDDPFGARPWRCGGHPEFRIPAMLDTIAISAKTDFVTLARRYFTNDLASQPNVARWKDDWLNRVYQLLAPRPEAELLAAAVLTLVLDEDARVATRAITFFATNPESDSADRLLELWQANRAAFERLNPGRQGRELRYWLLQSVGSRIKHVGAASVLLPAARTIAVEPFEKPEYFLDALQVG